MNKWLKHNKFALLRRISQFTLLLVFAGSHYWGWTALQGNYSVARVFESFYLSDPYAILQTFFAGYIVASSALIGGVIIFLLYALIFGRAFCSWVCPVNTIADATNYLKKLLNIKETIVKVNLNHKTRYWVMVGFLILSLIIGVAAFEFVSPIAIIHRGIIFGLGFGWSAILFIVLLDLFVKPYAWCGTLCPLGGFYSAISKFRLIKVHHELENCTNCNLCFKVCPEVQVLSIVGQKKGMINPGACTLCGKCVEVCDDDALKFSLNINKK